MFRRRRRPGPERRLAGSRLWFRAMAEKQTGDPASGWASAVRRLGRSGWSRPLLALAVLALGGFLLYRAFGQYGGRDVLASILAIPGYRLALAGMFAAASYA
ncbi:MAG: hypothetical protein ACREH3_08230, partial [Geminicoccales bacterium]